MIRSLFSQAEDGIRDYKVTGVQTCALPIWAPDAVALVVVAWLAGETVGAVAARRRAAGAPIREALGGSVRRAFDRRGEVGRRGVGDESLARGSGGLGR